MRFPTFCRPALLAVLCASGLRAAPGAHQASIVNRSRETWVLGLIDHGHGILVVTVTSKDGKAVSLDCPPGEVRQIRLRRGDEATLSFRESKGTQSRSATLGPLGALEAQIHGLFLQDGPAGLVLAATQQGPFRQKDQVLEIRAPESPACAIL